MKQFSKLAILFILLVALSCKKEDPTPVPPVITFVSAQLSADKSYSIVNFEFYDGDGDLGLKQEETAGEQAVNLLVDYYEKINGVWTLKSPIITWNPTANQYDTTELNLRVPFITNESKRALEGETEVQLLFNYAADTVRYEISLKDRAFHLSNVITTSELIIN